MNQRIVSIINDLATDSKISLDQLSQYYHISKRTLRNDINSINEVVFPKDFLLISMES